ncbi:MAG: hypothetical protein AVDCRST_MAG91-264, partial [uncultured Sphingomonadaceae bacterium]
AAPGHRPQQPADQERPCASREEGPARAGVVHGGGPAHPPRRAGAGAIAEHPAVHAGKHGAPAGGGADRGDGGGRRRRGGDDRGDTEQDDGQGQCASGAGGVPHPGHGTGADRPRRRALVDRRAGVAGPGQSRD